MRLAIAISLCVIAAACAAPPPAASSATASTSTPQTSGSMASAAPTATIAASAAPAPYRQLVGVPGHALASPDGRWIVAPRSGRFESPLQLYTVDGALVRELGAASYWTWLADSSGLFVAVLVPQRAPPMHLMDLEGRMTGTDLQLSNETLSRDGKLIVAEHQEGCCVAIVQREIRVARRDGTGTRTLVLSTSPEPQPVALLGVDASDRVVYRDGASIMRVPLAGGAAAQLAASADLVRVVPGGTSPDGLAIVARASEPTRWYTVADDTVRPIGTGIGVVVEDGNRVLGKQRGILWVGPHSFLTRDDTGAVFEVDAVTLARAGRAARLLATDVALAHGGGRLLIIRGPRVMLLDLNTGAVQETGLDLGPDSDSAHAIPVRGGGFILSSSRGTYRIDSGQ